MKRRKDGIEKTIAHCLAELDEADRAEPEVAQASVPAIKARLEKLHEEMAKLELYEQALNTSGDAQLSLTAPDCRAMNARGSAVVGYNVQTAVDTTHHLIAAHEVVNNPTDIALLDPMAQKARTALGTAELEVLSDRGYFAGPQIAACEESGIRAWVPRPLRSGNRKRGLFTKDDFVYEPEHDHYRCPAGELLTRRGWSVDEGIRIWSYAAPLATCLGCSMRAQCNRNPGARRIRRWEKESLIDAMQARLEQAPEKLQLRRQTVEHPFGTLKAWMGYTHFLTKTLPKVRTEMSLLVLAYNLKRVMRLLGVRRLLTELAAA